MTMRALLAVAIIAAGCATPPPAVELDDDDDVVRPRKPRRALEFDGQPVAVPPQFESGCVALDETEELLGVVTMLPFGKGTDGVVIDDGAVKWVVSYDAEGVFADFEKEQVLARGRRCDKEGPAVKGYHFDVQSLRVVR